MAGVEVEPTPTHGVAMHSASKGPYGIFFPYWQCKLFATHVPRVMVTAEDTGDQIMLEVRARKVTDPAEADSTMPLTLPQSFLDSSCGWMEIYLPEAAQAFLHTRDVVSAVKGMQVHVFRQMRGQVKVPGEEGEKWLPLGPETRTPLINMSIKPVGKSMEEYKWPPYLEVSSSGPHVKKRSFVLSYRIGGEGADKLCSATDGCKKPLWAYSIFFW